MSLRTKLILGFLVLSIVPLTGLTVYSYVNSLNSFRQLVQQESVQMADDMEGRMDRLTKDLGRRLGGLRQYGFQTLMDQPETDRKASAMAKEFYSELVSHMGDRAPMVRSLEFVPLQEDVETVLKAESVRVAGESKAAGKATAAASPSAVAPAPPLPPEAHGPKGKMKPIVIDLPEMEIVVSADASDVDQAVTFVHKGDRIELRQTWVESEEHSAELEKSIARLDRLAGSIERKAERLQQLAEEEQSRDTERKINQLQSRQAAVEAKREKLEFMLMLDLEKMALDEPQARSNLKARVDAGQLVNDLLRRLPRREDEIPFVIDEQGRIFTPESEDLTALEGLELAAWAGGEDVQAPDDWVVVTRRQPASGVTVGIARPIAEKLGDIRTAAVQNLGYGFGMVTLALLGIIPLSGGMTRSLSKLTQSANRLAKGDWSVRVPATSRDEIGQLGRAFNKMARDLQAHEEELVQQERLRKELEIGRQIQEELLPRAPLKLPFAEIQGVSIPAREVGGDFFNYFTLPDGRIALLIADVSGKGVGAALLMANLQATLSARLTVESDLAELAEALDRDLADQTPPSTFVTLFAAVLDGATRTLQWVNAGHNTQFVGSAGGRLEPLRSSGRPLGLLPGGGYEQEETYLQSGDFLFLYTDGLIEAENHRGQEFGEERLAELLRRSPADNPNATLAMVEEAAHQHREGREAGDDATMMVLRIS